MPAAIPMIAAIATSYGAQAVIGTTLAAQIASAVAGGLVAYGTSKVLGLDEPPTLQPPSSRVNAKSTVQPIGILYGRRRVAAAWAQLCGTGPVALLPHTTDHYVIDQDRLNLIAVWCMGEVDSLVTLYFDDAESTDPEYSGAFRHHFHEGTDDQLVDASFMTELERIALAKPVGTYWDDNSRMPGIAYSYLRLNFDPEVWKSGLPAITAEIKGRKILDVRTGLTAWSANPALVLYDYLTNARFGCGMATADLDTDSFIAAANHCDESVTFPATPDPFTAPRYECHAFLNPDDELMDNVRAILASFRAYLVFDGKYRVVTESPGTSSFTFDESNIVGAWNITLEHRDSRYNQVKAQFPNETKLYEDDYVLIDSAEYLANDGSQLLESSVNLTGVAQGYRAAAIAEQILRQSRHSLEVEFTATQAAIGVQVGDIVDMTHELPGWSGKLFRVLNQGMADDGNLLFRLREYSEDVYAAPEAEVHDSVPDTTLPALGVPEVDFYEVYPTTPEADGRLPVFIVWSCTADYRRAPRFLLEWKDTAGTVWTSILVESLMNTPDSEFGSALYQGYRMSLFPGTYDMRLRAVSVRGLHGKTATRTVSI